VTGVVLDAVVITSPTLTQVALALFEKKLQLQIHKLKVVFYLNLVFSY
jgi:hypothetical protein